MESWNIEKIQCGIWKNQKHIFIILKTFAYYWFYIFKQCIFSTFHFSIAILYFCIFVFLYFCIFRIFRIFAFLHFCIFGFLHSSLFDFLPWLFKYFFLLFNWKYVKFSVKKKVNVNKYFCYPLKVVNDMYECTILTIWI